MNTTCTFFEALIYRSRTFSKVVILTLICQFLPGGMTDSGYCGTPNTEGLLHSSLASFINNENQLEDNASPLLPVRTLIDYLGTQISWDWLLKAVDLKSIAGHKAANTKPAPPVEPTNQHHDDEDHSAHLHDHNDEEPMKLRYPAITRLAILFFFIVALLLQLTPILFS